MAIIDIDPAVLGVRHSIKGTTYSANLSGPHARIRFKGANQKTERQTLVRGNLAQAPAAWYALTAAQRTAWNALTTAPPEPVYNSLGQIISLSGFQWFSKLYARAKSVGATPLSNAPAGIAPILIFSHFAEVFTGDTTQSYIQFDAGYFQAGSYGVVFCTLDHGQGAPRYYRNWKLLWTLFEPGVAQHDLQPSIEALFGKPIQTTRAFFQCFNNNIEMLRTPADLSDTTVQA